jgi:uncharacterized membrane protein
VNSKQRRNLARLEAQAAEQQQPQSLVVSDPDLLINMGDSGSTDVTPNHQSQKIARAKLQMHESFSFSGPLPPPNLLKQYNEVVPNGAERLMKMAETQQAHRQELEKTVVHGNVEAESRGQWMGLFISIAVIAAGTYLAAIGRQVTGGILVGVDVVALASVFVIGKHKQQKELEKKRERLKPKKETPRS